MDEPQLPSNVLEIDVYEGEAERMTWLLKRVQAITSEAPA